ncbi:MAG: hypothetical protein M0Q95_03765 [Porticoccaceae bacterium]|nr:hypothetical protein [Porticoccaceae bacterium]
MAGYSDFSFTSLWARLGGAADKAVIATGNGPKGVVVGLSETEHTALMSGVTPLVGELEQCRVSTLETVDRRARLWVPLAGCATFLALLVSGQGLVAALVFGIVAAFAGWFVAMGNRSSVYQTEVKRRFASVISRHLAGFDHVVEPDTDLVRLHDWQLFPDLQSARTLDRMVGERGGFRVSLSEMSIAYAANRRNNKDHNLGDHTLTASVVEVASNSVGEGVMVLTPTDAPLRLLEAQEKAANLALMPTGDRDFDSAYHFRTSAPDGAGLLTAQLRAAILALEKVAPAGRPYLVFMPGSITVLFPTRLADLAFHVPPYWIPLDTGTLVAQFASDLALKNALLSAVVALSVVLRGS